MLSLQQRKLHKQNMLDIRFGARLGGWEQTCNGRNHIPSRFIFAGWELKAPFKQKQIMSMSWHESPKHGWTWAPATTWKVNSCCANFPPPSALLVPPSARGTMPGQVREALLHPPPLISPKIGIPDSRPHQTLTMDKHSRLAHMAPNDILMAHQNI